MIVLSVACHILIKWYSKTPCQCNQGALLSGYCLGFTRAAGRDSPVRICKSGPDHMADTNLGVIRIKGALGVGNVPATDVAARVARHPHLRCTAITEEGIDDVTAHVTGV